MDEVVFIKDEHDYDEFAKLRPKSIYAKQKVKFICSACHNECMKTFGFLTKEFICGNCKNRRTQLSDDVRKKIETTNYLKYGTKSPTQNKEIQAKQEKTTLAHLGVRRPFMSGTVREKYKQTCIEKYGIENTSSLESTRAAVIATVREKYGVDNVFQKEDFLERHAYMQVDEMNKKLAVLNMEYMGKNDNTIMFKCKSCGKIAEFSTAHFYRLLNSMDSSFCPYCSRIVMPRASFAEKDILSYIKSIYTGQVIENERNILTGQELDIYLPEKKLAFEYDGLYWHNELNKSNDYHIGKTDACEKIGIQLIHIFEDEWLYKQDIVKSRIDTLLGISKRIYARKCTIAEVPSKVAEQFLTINHLQGPVNSRYRYGLYYNSELVSLMTFGKSRFANEFELHRFCNKLGTTVVGGASRLFKYFLKMNSDIKEIISFADRRWSIGKLYERLGFKLVDKTVPSYYYIIDGIRHNRIEFQKHKLVQSGFDPTKTEHEIMLERKIYRIYDCGNLKYLYK